MINFVSISRNHYQWKILLKELIISGSYCLYFVSGWTTDIGVTFLFPAINEQILFLVFFSNYLEQLFVIDEMWQINTILFSQTHDSSWLLFQACTSYYKFWRVIPLKYSLYLFCKLFKYTNSPCAGVHSQVILGRKKSAGKENNVATGI